MEPFRAQHVQTPGRDSSAFLHLTGSSVSERTVTSGVSLLPSLMGADQIFFESTNMDFVECAKFSA